MEVFSYKFFVLLALAPAVTLVNGLHTFGKLEHNLFMLSEVFRYPPCDVIRLFPV